ncbi:MAG: VWA domain-containing protein [Planctomycetes bacterium]|nr:VWA domain-containing protein [Planctomycetota bacterium]
MFQHSIAFDSASYLLLLLLLPLMWWVSFQSLSGLGRWRRLLALTLRSVVFAIIVFSLADIKYQRRSDQMTVVYLLDQSLSIPTDQRQAMVEYVNTSIGEYHDEAKNDRFAVIVFGRDAAVEMPLVNVAIPLRSRLETILDPEYTDLANAIQRAKAIFPYDSAKRIVLITDGNQNVGDARRDARATAAAGVSIDVVPVILSARSEVAVEKVDVPANTRRGQPFEMRVVLRNDAPEGSEQTVSGKLRIIRKAGDREEILTEQEVEVPPGKRVYTIPEEIDQPDFYTYEARFSPNDPAADGMVQNNIASAFTQVRGKGHVLLIENWDKKGEADYLVERLRSEDIAVTVTPSDRLFTSLAELQRYDSVILANVSRSTGTDADNVSSFSDDQIDMLVRNTREMGCGLIMMGGPDTFGAGGWTNTELEKAMPVDFEIKNVKVTPVGALVLMMHAGEMPRGNYWQKRIAFESIKLLGSRDFCGLVQWNGSDQWLWGQSKGGLIRVGPNRKMMLGRVDKMSIGDMPSFDPALKMAAKAFAGIGKVGVKHMIIISDGDPTPATPAVLRRLKQQGVKVSTVAVGSHGTIGSQEMQKIASVTGGKYYVVKNAKALPRIYQREARRIARPLAYEPKPPVAPVIVSQHELIQGLEGGLPPISGFVLTSVKQNPLVEVIIRSPLPTTEKNSTILASWTYGAGKAVAFTTDAGARWASQWTQWENYDKFFSQMVRWSMRPTDDSGNYSIATDVRDGKTTIIVTALDKDDQFLNDQSMTATVVAPDMSSVPVRIEQTAPGRYVGEFDSEAAGSYLLVVNPGEGQAPIRSGVNVGYSAEYRDHQTNMALLRAFAELEAKGGPAGIIVEAGLNSTQLEGSEPTNPFRRDLKPAISDQSIWPWILVVGSCLFFADVFVRRVQVNFLWLAPLLGRWRDFVLRRQREAAIPETMSRLRSRKQEISQQIESRRATTRFESAETEEAPDPSTIATTTTKPGASPQKTVEPEEQPTEESYTERLLKAKRKVWHDRDQDGKGDSPRR